MAKVKKKVHLAVLKNLSYPVPNDKDFREKYPRYREYSSAIFLNDYRIKGSKDHNREFIFDTQSSGQTGIETKTILKALGIPEKIIEQIEFEE